MPDLAERVSLSLLAKTRPCFAVNARYPMMHASIPNTAEQRKAKTEMPPEVHTAIPHTASDERKRKTQRQRADQPVADWPFNQS